MCLAAPGVEGQRQALLRARWGQGQGPPPRLAGACTPGEAGSSSWGQVPLSHLLGSEESEAQDNPVC